MRIPTEVRKGDVKKAIILALICVVLSSLLYLKWLKAGKDRKITISEEVRQVQAKLQSSTKARGQLMEISEKIQLIRELVKSLESSLPSKIELSGKYGKEIIDKLGENKLTLLSISNSDPEKVAEKLYKIEYTFRLSGTYTDILNFIHDFENNLWECFRKLKFGALEENSIEADLVLVIYGVEK